MCGRASGGGSWSDSLPRDRRRAAHRPRRGPAVLPGCTGRARSGAGVRPATCTPRRTCSRRARSTISTPAPPTPSSVPPSRTAGRAFRSGRRPRARCRSAATRPAPRPPCAREPLALDRSTGIWSAARAADLSGSYYLYLVEVFVPGVGRVLNRVTDPYSVSLTTDSRRSYVAALDAQALKPPGWDATPRPRVAAATDLVIYELHVRDFSATRSERARGASRQVPRVHRRRVRRHAPPRALAAAGVTDVHLLPVFDFATVPESGCLEPASRAAARQRAAGHGDSRDRATATASTGATTRCTTAPPRAATRATPPTARGASSSSGRWCWRCTALAFASAWTSSTTTRWRPARTRSRCSTASCPATTSGSTPRATSSARPAARTRPPRTG